MKLYSVGVRGGLKKISKAAFREDEAYLIDDSKYRSPIRAISSFNG